MQKQFNSSGIDPSQFLKKRPIKGQNRSSKSKKKIKTDDNSSKYRKEMESGQFRYQNEFLYTTDSKESLKYFTENNNDLDAYHKGYNNQIASWPKRPLDVIINMIERKTNKYQDCKLVDLGCGLGELYEKFYDKKKQSLKVFKEIYSYDFKAFKPHIKVVDIAKLPHEDESQDVAVFCLSLMGKNYLDFQKEARRVLAKNGTQIVAEVNSRFASFKIWSRMVESMGFKKQIWYQNIGGYFILAVWIKTHDGISDSVVQNEIITASYKDEKETTLIEDLRNQDLHEISNRLLRPCIYKKR